MNPYWGTDFISFLALFVQRVCTGAILQPTSDEIQVLTLSAVAAACGLLGPFLVLRRMTMLANSLSHTVLLGIVAFALVFGGSLLGGALIAALLTGLLTEGLHKLFRIPEDASIGLVFTSLFALALCLIALFMPNAHMSVEAVMGNPDLLQIADLKRAGLALLCNALFIALFFERLRLTTFDSGFAQALGLSPRLYQTALLFMTSWTLVSAFRAVGLILVLGFLVGPYLSMRLLSPSLKRILWGAPLLGAAVSLVGVALSRHLLTATGLPLSTAGLVATLLPLSYVALFALHRRRAI